MELKVYNWEYFERSKTRYIIFTLIILLVVVVSVFSNNIFWWVLVLIVAWCYIFLITKTNNVVKMIIWEKALQIDNNIYKWNDLSWFVLEYHVKKEKIHNIVIVDNKNNSKIYTINDTEDNLKNFVNNLSAIIPMLDKYDQTTMDKFIRKLKL